MLNTSFEKKFLKVLNSMLNVKSIEKKKKKREDLYFLATFKPSQERPRNKICLIYSIASL